MPQLSRSTLLLVLLLALVCACACYVTRHTLKFRERFLERALEAREAQQRTTGFTFARPWMKLNPTVSLFAFSDSEWSTLTNMFSGELHSLLVLTFPEGEVRRVTSQEMLALARSSPETIQTNVVWFFKP